MLKKFSFPWFGRTGLLVYPISVPGLLISIAVLGYLVYSFIDIDSRSHSASDTLRPFIITSVMVYVIYCVIALVTGSIIRRNK
jgi:hypothetical protein